MTKIVVAAPADADTLQIMEHLEREAGLPAAAKYSESFAKLYDRLAVHPESGAPRKRLGRDIRIGVVSPYVIYYRHEPTSDLVTIARVLHGSRRVTRRLLR